jgi:hypothetical protein
MADAPGPGNRNCCKETLAVSISRLMTNLGVSALTALALVLIIERGGV